MERSESQSPLPQELANTPIGELSYDQILEVVEQLGGGGISLGFAGKTATRRLARRVRPRVMRRVTKYGIGSEEQRAQNRLIEGDNLQAMTTLYKERGKIDLILTDPPYNTGNDFRYNDKWDTDPNDPGLGEWVGSEDGARRTKWMKFMWPRLAMMKAMLKPGGVLAICIDHRELFHLGQMLDELFGEQNRLAIINWQKSYSPRNDKQHVSTATEYVLVYAKDETKAKTGLMERTARMDARYQSRDGDRPWKSGDLSAGKGPTNQPMVYGIQSPFTGEIHYPPEGRCWGWGKNRIKEVLGEWGSEYEERILDDASIRARAAGVPITNVLAASPALMIAGDLAAARAAAVERLAEGPWPTVYFGVSGNGRPAAKRYLDEVKQGVVPWTWWADDDHDSPPDVLGPVSWSHEQSGHSQTGVDELSAMVGDDHGFKTVKPLKLFMKVIQIWCPPGGTVIDPFAGSGTAGHAVLALNQAAGADRRFILVEQGRPDRGDPYATALTAARLRNAVTGEWASGAATPLTGGFEFLRLGRKVDAAALLKMERDEMIDTVIESHFDATRRRGAQLTRFDGGFRYLVAQNSDGAGFFLVWDGPAENTDITEEVYEQIAAEASAAGLSSRVYHVYARLWVYQTDDVHFLQIPDRILADFGLDARSEPFAEPDTD